MSEINSQKLVKAFIYLTDCEIPSETTREVIQFLRDVQCPLSLIASISRVIVALNVHAVMASLRAHNDTLLCPKSTNDWER